MKMLTIMDCREGWVKNRDGRIKVPGDDHMELWGRVFDVITWVGIFILTMWVGSSR